MQPSEPWFIPVITSLIASVSALIAATVSAVFSYRASRESSAVEIRKMEAAYLKDKIAALEGAMKRFAEGIESFKTQQGEGELAATARMIRYRFEVADALLADVGHYLDPAVLPDFRSDSERIKLTIGVAQLQREGLIKDVSSGSVPTLDGDGLVETMGRFDRRLLKAISAALDKAVQGMEKFMDS
jgi:hypothetical protein